MRVERQPPKPVTAQVRQRFSRYHPRNRFRGWGNHPDARSGRRNSYRRYVMGWLSGTPRKAVTAKVPAAERRRVSEQRSAARKLLQESDRLSESGDDVGARIAADKAHDLNSIADDNERG